MKVLIIGGSGFVGSHIVDKFLSENWDVTVFDRQLELYRSTLEGVKFERGDINDKALLDSIIARRFDVVVHSLSTTTPKTSNDNPEFDITSNLISTVNLLEMCSRHKVGKFIYLSSGGSIYGDTDVDEHVETDMPFPICSYAITKLAAEKYLYMYEKIYGLNYSILRISNPYGPRQNPLSNQGVIAIFLHKILKRERIEIWGDGSTIRDYIYVTDVADACYQSVNDARNNIYNIGSNIGISLKELVLILGEITGIAPEIVWLPERGMDVPKIILNCESAEKLMNWKPKTSLETGIKNTISWLSSNMLIPA